MTQVKEKTTILNTGRENQAIKETTLINGRLLACIIQTNKKTRVRIWLKDFPEIILFDSTEIEGERYYALETMSVDEEYNRLNYRSSKWYLNDSLVIEVTGQKDTEANIILRYE